MRCTTGNASALAGKRATTSADINNDMNDKRFKSHLRFTAVVLIDFLAVLSMLEILMHL